MTLRERILILLSLAFCGYWGLEYIAYRQIVEPKLERLEYVAALQQIQKCEKAIKDQAGELQAFAEQLSRTRDLPEMLQQPVLPESISAKADILGLADETGRWQRLVFVTKFSEVPDAADFLDKLRKGDTPLITSPPSSFSQHGIAASTVGPLLVGSSPCSISRPGGVQSGTLIVGRFLTAELFDSVQKRIYTNFVCVPYTPQLAARLPEQSKYNFDVAETNYFCQKLGEELVQCYAILRDTARQPVLILRTDIPQDLLQDSRNIFYMSGFIRLAATVPAIILLTIVFQIAVVSPILRLVKDIVAIGRGQFAHKPRSENRRDEIGILAREFDRMLERLDAAQKKLVEKSFVSGMAEMSSGILHNARNALSPVVSGLERMGEKIAVMDSPEIRQAISEIEQNNADPNRRANLQRFLLLSVQAQQQYVQQARANLDDLSRQVCQIEEMLNGQRSFRGAAKPLESVALKRLIEDAFELVPANLRAEVRIQVDAQIEQLRPIHVQRVVFLQVLENLLINAAESLRRAGPLCPKIKISARVEPVDNIEMLHLEIEDNGAGIEPKIMEKLFERGNSTKPRGMSGIGLHWCANTIAAMNGRVWAKSKGENRGACFHIEMPVLQDKQSRVGNVKGPDHESECKTQNIAG
jgi:signal transduction histidine kinase